MCDVRKFCELLVEEFGWLRDEPALLNKYINAELRPKLLELSKDELIELVVYLSKQLICYFDGYEV